MVRFRGGGFRGPGFGGFRGPGFGGFRGPGFGRFGEALALEALEVHL